MMAANVRYWLVSLAFLCAVASHCAAEPLNVDDNLGNNVCGPRCVQFLLEYYGIKADLIELIEEMQWPAFEDGSSMQQVQKAIERRGIRTRAIRTDPRARFTGSEPVVVHLNRLAAEEDKLGHFVVWVPAANGQPAQIWDGLRGFSPAARSRLLAKMSGVALLTSQAPIDAPASRLASRPRLWLVSILLVGAALAWCAVVRPLRLFGLRKSPSTMTPVAKGVSNVLEG